MSKTSSTQSTVKDLAHSFTILHHKRGSKLTKTFSRGVEIGAYDTGAHLERVTSFIAKTPKQLKTHLEKVQRKRRKCIIRGELLPEGKRPSGRLRRRGPTNKTPYFDDVPRCWVMIDIDKLALPERIASQADNPAGAAAYARAQLPPEFQAVACVWQASASAGFSDQIKLHLWFFLSEPLTCEQARCWLADRKPIDPAVLRAVQPHYTAAPEVLKGADPMPVRVGLLGGPEKHAKVPAHVLAGDFATFRTLSVSSLALDDLQRPETTRDVPKQALVEIKKRQRASARKLLVECTENAYGVAYRAGTILGYWLAREAFNAGGWRESVRKQAAVVAERWGRRFKNLPNTSQPERVYVAQVQQGIDWGVAASWRELCARQESSPERLAMLEALRERAAAELEKLRGKLAKDKKVRLKQELKKLGTYTQAEDKILSRKAVREALGAYLEPDKINRWLAEAEPIALDSWRTGLKYTSGGEIKANESNTGRILKHHPAWQNLLRFNDRAKVYEWIAKTPWGVTYDEPRPFSEDDDLGSMVTWFADVGMSEVSGDLLIRTLKSNRSLVERMDPLVDYLNDAAGCDIASMTKKQARKALRALSDRPLDTWLADRFGADNDPEYLRLVGPKMLISAVARAYNPGAQCDSMLVLVGEEGLRKTSTIRLLAGVIPDGFRPLKGITDRDSLMSLQTPVLMEAGELQAFQGRTAEHAKSFLTEVSDHFRAPYDRIFKNHPRRVVFFGSTNEAEFLSGPGDQRRYWPVTCTRKAETLSRKQARALWLEAALRWRAGERWWLETDDEKALHAKEIAKYRGEGIYEGRIKEQLKKAKIYTLEQIKYKVEPDKSWRLADQHELLRCLKVRGWENWKSNGKKRWRHKKRDKYLDRAA